LRISVFYRPLTNSPQIDASLGRVVVQSSYWLMQLRDRLDEAKSRRRDKKREVA